MLRQKRPKSLDEQQNEEDEKAEAGPHTVLTSRNKYDGIDVYGHLRELYDDGNEGERRTIMEAMEKSMMSKDMRQEYETEEEARIKSIPKEEKAARLVKKFKEDGLLKENQTLDMSKLENKENVGHARVEELGSDEEETIVT